MALTFTDQLQQTYGISPEDAARLAQQVSVNGAPNGILGAAQAIGLQLPSPQAQQIAPPAGTSTGATTGFGGINETPSTLGTNFTPDFRFAVDPSNPDQSANFINSLLTQLGPALSSGQFSNFQQSPNDLGNALAGFQSASPFENALNQLISGQLGQGGNQQLQSLISTLFGQPAVQSLSTGRASQGLGDLNQQVSGTGFGGNFNLASGGTGTAGSVSSALLGQPTQQSLGTGRASQGIEALLQQLFGGGPGFQTAGGGSTNIGGVSNTLLGQPGVQSLSTGRASQGLQGLSGGDALGGQLGARASQFLSNPLTAEAPGIQGSAQNVIQSNLGGNLSQDFRDAQRRQVFEPSQERLLGQLNQLGGGVGALGSGLPAEFLRRNEQDFQDRLTNFGFQAQQNAIPQATQLGGQQFGQQTQNIQNILAQAQLGGGFQSQLFNQPFGVAQAQGQLGQNQQQINQQAIGLGSNIQNQGFAQILQALGQQGQLGQAQQGLNQAAVGLGFQGQNQGFNQILQTLLAQGSLGQNQQRINQSAFGIGGQLQNQLAQQGFTATGQGLTREGLALQNQQQRNQFGLGQSAIGSDILQTLLAGREGGGGLGTILALLTGSGGGGGLLDAIPGLIDIFRGGNQNPNEGEGGGSTPPTTHPPGTDTGGFTLPPDLIPGLIDIFFPGGLGGIGGSRPTTDFGTVRFDDPFNFPYDAGIGGFRPVFGPGPGPGGIEPRIFGLSG